MSNGWLTKLKERLQLLYGKLVERTAPLMKRANERLGPSWTRFSEWIKVAYDRVYEKAAPYIIAKTQNLKLRERLKNALPQDLAKTLPSTFEPLAVAEWMNQAFQRKGAGYYGRIVTIVLCTFFLADLTALLAERFIPQVPPAHLTRLNQNKKPATLEDFNIIFARNLFNSQGKIFGEESPGGPQNLDQGGPPQRTTLPFNLIGTLILRDELRSIATIEDKSASAVYPVRVEDEIPSKAKIISIEANKVVFLNTTNNHREYVELVEDIPAGNPRVTVGVAKKEGGPAIEKTAPNTFNVSRTEVDKTLADLNNVLTQARAVPNFENGVPNGYKLFQIVPGSIYEKLGLQNGDTITGLNGQPVNDPGKAFEMLSELKTAGHMELQVKRDGKSQGFAYDIH